MEHLKTNLLWLVLFSVGIGGLIRILSWLWMRIWHLNIQAREGGILAGAVIAFWIVFASRLKPSLAALQVGLIVGGYFLVKLVKHFIEKRTAPPETGGKQ
jgi:hypothetical protein